MVICACVMQFVIVVKDHLENSTIRPSQVVFLFLVLAKSKIGCGREGLAIMPLFIDKYYTSLCQYMLVYKTFYRLPQC